MTFAAISAFVVTYGGAIAAAASVGGLLYSGEKKAQADEFNAKVADQNAQVASTQGNAREEDQRQRGRQMIGRQLAASAESGTELTGSNLDLLHTSLYGMAIDSSNIRYETQLRSSGLQTQAMLNRQQADSTRTGSYLSAAGKLIGASKSYTSSGGTIPGTGIPGGMIPPG